MCALLSGPLFYRLCLSITDFHPDTWNPAWSVSTILTGLLSFMVEKGPTLGSIETSEFTVRGGERGWCVGGPCLCPCSPSIRERPRALGSFGSLGVHLASWAALRTEGIASRHSACSTLLLTGVYFSAVWVSIQVVVMSWC